MSATAANFADAPAHRPCVEPAQFDELMRTLATLPAEPRALAGEL